MKRALAAWVAAFLAALVLVLAPASAFAKYQPPPLQSAVVDQAGVLDDAAEARIAQRLDALRREKGFAIVVFLPSTIEGESIEDVAYETFNTWQVGATGKDDGVLLVIATAERKVRIETGKGVGDRLTDVQSSRIIRELLAPRLQKQDYEGAVEEGTRSIERALSGEEPVATPPKAPSRTVRKSIPLTSTQKWIIGGVVVLVIFLAIVSSGFRRVLFSILEILLWVAFFGRRGGGGGGDGGGGGYSGGGGRSGGGGASGGY